MSRPPPAAHAALVPTRSSGSTSSRRTPRGTGTCSTSGTKRTSSRTGTIWTRSSQSSRPRPTAAPGGSSPRSAAAQARGPAARAPLPLPSRRLRTTPTVDCCGGGQAGPRRLPPARPAAGNTVMPLAELHPNARFHACDFSPKCGASRRARTRVAPAAHHVSSPQPAPAPPARPLSPRRLLAFPPAPTPGRSTS